MTQCTCGAIREANGYCKVCDKVYNQETLKAELRAAQIGLAILKEFPFPPPGQPELIVDRFCDLRDALKDARIKLDRVAAELLMHINDEDFTMSLTNLYVYLTEDK